jgi:tetratricopeptide (TPR) repeat protein
LLNYAPFLNKLTHLGVFEKIGIIHELIPSLDQKLHADCIADLNKAIDHAEKIKHILLNKNELENLSEKELTQSITSFTEFFVQHNMPELATHFLIKSIDLYPHQSQLYATLSDIFIKMNLLDDAATTLREATTRDPNTPEYWLIAANISCQQGEFQAAIKCLEHVFELQPLGLHAKRILAQIFVQLDLWDQADIVLQDILSQHPNDPDTLYEKGLMNLRRGNLEGFKDFEKRSDCIDFPTHIFPQLQKNKKWRGEPLKDKKILIVNDLDAAYFFLFASLFQGIIQESKHCTIEVNQDTLSILARSFNNTSFITSEQIEINAKNYHLFSMDTYIDHDYWVQLGDLAQYRLNDYAQHLTLPLLKPAPQRLEYWQNELKHLNNRLKIGINPELYPFLNPFWEKWQPLFKQSNIDFFALTHDINLELKPNYGIHPCPYPQDASSEEKSAFLSQLSFVITPFSHEANLAALLGIHVIQLTKIEEWSILGQTESPFFKNNMHILPYSLSSSFDVQIPQLVAKTIEVIQKNGTSPHR